MTTDRRPARYDPPLSAARQDRAHHGRQAKPISIFRCSKVAYSELWLTGLPTIGGELGQLLSTALSSTFTGKEDERAELA